MAVNYGNTKITPSRTIVRKPQVSPRPIIDEENPMPEKYEGDIVFNKTIYSKTLFENKVDTNFNELNLDQSSITIEEFFNSYNEIFFDIPKEGENSHSTIIQTSLDYVNDYENPLQPILDAAYEEIELLQRLKLEAETRLQGLLQEQEAEDAADEASLAAYVGEFGEDFETNPLLKYGKLKQNLEILDDRGELRKSLNKNLNDLRQAKEKEDGNVNTKSYNQWNASIDKRAEGKVKDDLKDLISITRTSIAARNGYQI